MRLTAMTLSILLGVLLLHVVTAVVKRGSCPGAPVRPNYCHPSEVKNLCNDDSVCNRRRKCCPTYCGKMCTEPGPVKPGSCPAVYAFFNCEHPIRKECDFDSICPGKQKCCQDGCVIQCTEPLDDAPIKPGKCPPIVIPFLPCPPEEDYPCDYDRDCDGIQKCCPTACQYSCQAPTE